MHNCLRHSLPVNHWVTILSSYIYYILFQYLADIEDHLNVTIQQIEPDMKVPSNEFDGKVVYGQKRKQVGTGYQVTQITRQPPHSGRGLHCPVASKHELQNRAIYSLSQIKIIHI